MNVRDWTLRLRALLRPGSVERDLHDELSFHIERETMKLIAATAFFALVPALQASRIEPARTLRGALIKDARPGRARNILIGVQVFASALLLICSAIFLRSAIASSQFNPGFRTADTLSIDTINDNKRHAMLQALGSDHTLLALAGARPPLLARPPRAFGDVGSGKIALSYK